ncbi:hypothetical protein BCR35DRAFT_309436 [Leucosporidium creatinivorum]|uniref:F-box domain-containing protein n=1 Tax=Leucosporidium creatinivorum TaxID=106004 RepID=A0A1Y2DHH4_9BASI|nr:hypothetical protein BCR35DRAFT_309436 [Leucosporidium creatinivorum]
MTAKRSTTTLHDLPPELIATVLSHCTLASAIALSQASSRLRSITSDSPAWIEPLEAAAEAAGVHILRRPPPHLPPSDVDWDGLAAAGGRPIPSRAFVQLLPVLSRDFLLKAELPRLPNSQWREICERRFLPAVLSREVECKGEDDGSLWMKGRWKGVFLKLIGRLEHRDQTACAQEDHSCRYVVLHRKAGITRNRMSTREYDPLRVFEELKRQNSLGHYTTVQVLIPAKFLPVDVTISVYVTIGRSDAFLTNPTVMDLLDQLGGWRRDGSGPSHAILGPAL